MIKLIFIVTFVLVQHVLSAVVELNDESFAAKTKGKVAFIKFYSPWCGHCKDMASDWEKLGAEYDGNDDVIIGEVDCTDDDSEEVCEEQNVEGFPTLKYGDVPFLEDYDGERSYEKLFAFAEENLKPSCSLKNMDLCSPNEKSKIDKYLQMSIEDIELALDEVNKKIEVLEEDMDEAIAGLESAYEELIETSENIKANAKKSDYGVMKAVLAVKLKTQGRTEDL